MFFLRFIFLCSWLHSALRRKVVKFRCISQYKLKSPLFPFPLCIDAFKLSYLKLRQVSASVSVKREPKPPAKLET